eukprot:15476667-Alexandrium_andersonii.AAC.1
MRNCPSGQAWLEVRTKAKPSAGANMATPPLRPEPTGGARRAHICHPARLALCVAAGMAASPRPVSVTKTRLA